MSQTPMPKTKCIEWDVATTNPLFAFNTKGSQHFWWRKHTPKMTARSKWHSLPRCINKIIHKDTEFVTLYEIHGRMFYCWFCFLLSKTLRLFVSIQFVVAKKKKSTTTGARWRHKLWRHKIHFLTLGPKMATETLTEKFSRRKIPVLRAKWRFQTILSNQKFSLGHIA